MEIEEMLKRLVSSLDGIKSLVVSSREGLLISSAGSEVDAPSLCALGAKLISGSKWVGKRLDLKDFELTTVEFKDCTVLAYGYGSVSIMAILERGSNIHLIKLLLKSSAEEIESLI